MWTPETIAAFNEMKLQVSKCLTMHFLSDTAPITLHTDASDYGVGVINRGITLTWRSPEVE